MAFTASYSVSKSGTTCSATTVTDTSNYGVGNSISRSDFQYRRVTVKDYLLGTTLGIVDLPPTSDVAIFSTSILNLILSIEIILIPPPPGSIYNAVGNVLNPCI